MFAVGVRRRKKQGQMAGIDTSENRSKKSAELHAMRACFSAVFTDVHIERMKTVEIITSEYRNLLWTN